MNTDQQAGVLRRAASSSAWLVLTRFATKGVDFLVLLALARLLTPIDFGMVAIAMSLVLIVEAIFELPISQVLVQLPSYDKVHLDTAFTLSLLRGLAIGLILIALSVPFSIAFHNSRLIALISALSLAPGMRGLVSPAMAHWVRSVDFRREVSIELFGKALSMAASLTLAMQYPSYWALVLGTIVTPFGMMVLSYVVAPYRPRLSLRAWRDFVGFLGWTSAAQILTAINWQCDRLALAQFVSQASLGQYSLANDLSYVPEQALIKPVARPLMSAFALVRHAADDLAKAYLRVAVSIFMIGTPVMLGFSLLAEPAVRLALGGKWMASVPILQWLSLSLIPPLYSAGLSSLALALGKPSILFRRSVIEIFVKVPPIVIGAWTFGVTGVVCARLVSIAGMTLVDMVFARTIMGISVPRQLLSVWRSVGAGLVMAAILVPLRPLAFDDAGLILAGKLGVLAVIGLLSYAIALITLWRVAGSPNCLEASLVSLISTRLHKRRMRTA